MVWTYSGLLGVGVLDVENRHKSQQTVEIINLRLVTIQGRGGYLRVQSAVRRAYGGPLRGR